MTETTVEERIGARIDPGSAKEIAVRESAGGIAFTNAAEMMEGAKLLAVSGEMIPKHLRGKPGACFAIIMQAYEWKLSPIQVANKSYFVNDRVAYEAQLVAAVALQRAPIKGRPRYEFEGTGDALMCRVSVEMMEGGSVEGQSPPLGQIHPKNSPLWKSDRDSRLGYHTARSAAGISPTFCWASTLGTNSRFAAHRPRPRQGRDASEDDRRKAGCADQGAGRRARPGR